MNFPRDEKIDFFEFVTAVVDHSKVFKNEHIKKAFHLLDTDNSGTITQENFMIILPRETDKKNELQSKKEDELWK